MRFNRLATELSESVAEVQPEVRETLASVRTAADTATVILVVIGCVAVAVGIVIAAGNSRG